MKLSLLISLFLFSAQAFAGPAVQRLQTFSSELDTLRADFVQLLYDQDQQLVQRSHGKMLLKRPGKFRWDYIKPYTQEIVADGKSLWTYDAELAQVTVKAADTALGAAPISLLSERRNLLDDFLVKELGPREDLEWVELEPKIKDTDFTKIYLGLDEKTMRVMELRDNFGQVTQIRFDNVEMNIPLADKLFHFEPPAGADVIGTP